MTTDPTLALRDVVVAFGGVTAVDRVSLSVDAGTIVALVGQNGAGKTSLLNAISGYVRATGEIRWNTQDLLRLPAHRRAGLGIARTFQDVQLFDSMTVLDNVLVGMHSTLKRSVIVEMLGFPIWASERQARDRALESLRLLHVDSHADTLAGGLPFGTQKLVGVARALASRPRLLLMDEPAAGLVQSEVDSFAALLEGLRREFGVGILLVEHNLHLVRAVADRAVVLDRGSILSVGTPDEVVRDARVIEAYLGAPSVDPTLGT